MGAGQPYYKASIGMPHLHRAVPDALNGYAEPIAGDPPIGELWRMFLRYANIEGAPDFELPRGNQLDLLL